MKGKGWALVCLTMNSWNSLWSGYAAFLANADCYPVCARCVSGTITPLSEHSPASQFLNSEVQVLCLPPWSSRLLPPCYLPYVKSSSLPISPPELAPTEMAKNLPYWTFVTKKSHILTMPVSIQTASHSPHPTHPSSPILFLCSERQRENQKSTARVYI